MGYFLLKEDDENCDDQSIINSISVKNFRYSLLQNSKKKIMILVSILVLVILLINISIYFHVSHMGEDTVIIPPNEGFKRYVQETEEEEKQVYNLFARNTSAKQVNPSNNIKEAKNQILKKDTEQKRHYTIEENDHEIERLLNSPEDLLISQPQVSMHTNEMNATAANSVIDNNQFKLDNTLTVPDIKNIALDSLTHDTPKQNDKKKSKSNIIESTNFRLNIGGYLTHSLARNFVLKIRNQYPELLSGLNYYIVPYNSGNTDMFKILLGDFSKQEDVARLANKLHNLGIEISIEQYSR